MKIKSIDEFIKYAENLKDFNERNKKRKILVCAGTGCQSSNSLHIVDNLNKRIAELGLRDKAYAQITGCLGFCAKGPIVKIEPDDTFYVEVKPEDAFEIVEKHILGGQCVERLLYSNPNSQTAALTSKDVVFYKKQMRVALHNCGVIDPELIEEYIVKDGYIALCNAINTMSSLEIIQTIKDSGLRGRGGAGFPTGDKWESTFKCKAMEKFIICNADEGDPGAFMDRSILEGDPHSILEAMTIAAYATQATHGYIYVRAEYPLAISRLETAIAQSQKLGLLGADILGCGFSFDIELSYGAGAFVCGEATALIRSIEGKRGEPRMKPPSSSKQGLWKQPTCVNNVETLANIPIILRKGAKWYSAIGTKTSKGTKVFALGGKVNNVGLVEVPMGITLREIIYEIGGGIPNGRRFKAVQTGGPSGGCLPESFLDTPIDYESLGAIGSMMGSGGMLVLDDSDCMVNIAKFFLEFTVDESCGKCTPCRIGTKRMHEILERITAGKAQKDDLRNLQTLAAMIKKTSLCGLGKTAPNPVLSTLKHFGDEYTEHIEKHRCRAGVCSELTILAINDSCKGCAKCIKICPAGAISGSVKHQHTIDNTLCLNCNACIAVCPFNAIARG